MPTAGIGSVLVHAVYLVNLATPDEELYAKSVDTMRLTTRAACAIEADGVVFHVGSHLGSGFEAGSRARRRRSGSVLEECSDTTWLLVENSAGAGGTMGRSVDEIAAVVDALDRHPRLGVCLDACHLYVSGVDVTDREALDATLSELDAKVGLDRLRALHVNDAAAPLGSNRDRHANVARGRDRRGDGRLPLAPEAAEAAGGDGDARPGRPRPRRRGDGEAARPARALAQEAAS